MSRRDIQSKKVIKAAAIVLPILLISGGVLIWRAGHHSKTSPTLNQSPQSLTGNGSGSQTQEGAQTKENGSSSVSVTRTGARSGSSTSGESVGSNGHQQNLTSSEKGASPSVSNGSPSTGSHSAEASNPTSNPATPSAEHASGQGSEKVANSPVSTPKGCFTISFHHKRMASHSTDDECSHHRNLIKLNEPDINLGSVCIRVNGTPVHYKRVSGRTDEFILGAVAGPKDEITAHFCIGRTHCSESCIYPKHEVVKRDEFLDAIGGGSADGSDPSLAQWEASDAKKNVAVNKALNGEIKKAIEGQKAAARKLAADNTSLPVFDGWIKDSESRGCTSHEARSKHHEVNRLTASRQ